MRTLRAAAILALVAAIAEMRTTEAKEPVYVTKVEDVATALKARKLQGQEVFLYTQSHALLIGQADYVHWDKLDSVKGEVDRLRWVLERHGFKVELHADLKAAELSPVIDDFVRRRATIEGSRVLIYFAGHGWTREVGRTFGYVLPVDAPAESVGEHALAAYALPMAQFDAWAQTPDARHMLFVFDSCFAGSFFTRGGDEKSPVANGPEASDYILSARARGRVRQFITAGGKSDRVPESSVFTQLLTQILEGLRAPDVNANYDAWTTGREIGVWLEQNATRFYRQTTRPATPIFGELPDPLFKLGDFVFARLDQPDTAPPAAVQRSRPVPTEAVRASAGEGPPASPSPGTAMRLPGADRDQDGGEALNGPPIAATSPVSPLPASRLAPPDQERRLGQDEEERMLRIIAGLSSDEVKERRDARSDLARFLAVLPREKQEATTNKLLRDLAAKSYRYQLGVAEAIARQNRPLAALHPEEARAQIRAAAERIRDPTLDTALRGAAARIVDRTSRD